MSWRAWVGWEGKYAELVLNGGRRCITCIMTYYRGVAKFCMFHKRGLLPSCTSVVRISWAAETLRNFVPPLSVSETQVNKRLLVSYYKLADVQTSDHSQYQLCDRTYAHHRWRVLEHHFSHLRLRYSQGWHKILQCLSGPGDTGTVFLFVLSSQRGRMVFQGNGRRNFFPGECAIKRSLKRRITCA